MTWPALADLSRLPLPGMDHPGDVAFTPDGDALTYLQGESGSLVRSLWRHDLRSGERVLLAGPGTGRDAEEHLSREERLQRERRRTSALGVTEHAWLRDAPQPTLLVPMGGRAFVAIGDETRDGVRPLAGVEGASCVIGAPNGSGVAFVRDGDLWTVPLPHGTARQLTFDAADGVTNGLAEYAAAEELDRFEGLWWSGDGRHIAYAHVDERNVPALVISHLGADQAEHEEHRYPFAGGANASVTLRIVPANGGEPVEAALPMDPGDYLARVVRDPRGGWLVAVLPRAQRELHWLRVAVDGSADRLWTESSDPWLNLDDHTRILRSGVILRSTERSGYRHLEWRDPDGRLGGQLTSGPWMVTAVTHVDEELGQVFFLGTADGAAERHLYRIPLDAPSPIERPERLTLEAGWHEVAFAPDGQHWSDTWSDLQDAPQLVVRATTNGSVTPVWSSECSEERLGIRAPEMLDLAAADGQARLHALLYRPTRAATTPPPCVVWVYGGPNAQYVKRSWEATANPLRQYLCAAGVAVLVVDNRGSAYRGLGFEAALAGRLGCTEVADQAAAVRQLAESGEIDAGRVGITGGSFGGFMTLRAMAQEPDLFRVGVAVAPVTDWLGYDTAYTERYLGHPKGSAEAYAESSAIDDASRIRGSLLLIHGAIDENVHLRHSTRLVAALQAEGLDVELVILPEDRHRTRTQSGLRTRDRRTVWHLLDGLGVARPGDGDDPERDQAATGS